jgi:hypothetical protein
VGLVPVAVSNFYVVGTAVWRFFDVQVGDVQDDFFAVSGCDAPLALFALFGTVVVGVRWGRKSCGVRLVGSTTFWKRKKKRKMKMEVCVDKLSK